MTAIGATVGENRVAASEATARTWERWAVAGLVLLAAVVRLVWAVQPRLVWGDEPYYLWSGQSLLNGAGYRVFDLAAAHFEPLFPLLAALLARLAQAVGVNAPGALMFGSAAIYVVAGALLVLPIYGIARRLTGTRSGLAAGLLLAVSPPLAVGALLWGTMTEPLFLLLIAVAWWGLLVAQQDNRLWTYVLAGASLGLAYLTRGEALIYLVAGLAALVALRVGQRRLIPRTLAGIGLAVAAFFVLISPYLLTQYLQSGELRLTEEAGFAYTSMQGLAAGDTAAFDKATWGLDPASGEVYLFAPSSEDASLLGLIIANPHAFVRLLHINVDALIAKGFSARLIPWPLAALAALGLFFQPWDARQARGELLVAASLAGSLSFLLFFIQERYLAGALIAATVWIGEGAAALGTWLIQTIGAIGGRSHTGDEEPIRRPLAAILSVLPTVLLALALLWQGPRLWADMQQTHSFQPGHLRAAEKLRALGVSGDAVVMSRYPAIAFHAGTRWTPTPAAAWPEVASYARKHNARYLVIDEWETRLRPQFRNLLDPSTAPAGLRHVATLDSDAGPVMIYEFAEAQP
jgi:4-amino-4-deoxy-L-arabinose transferase-like glycosyltransferase